MAQERNSKGQFSGAVFNYDTLSPALKRLLPIVDAATDLTFDAFEARTESVMRQDARWTDRTSNARNGLKAKHEARPMIDHTLILYHTMPYGFWLEVRWSGRYAVIGPTMFKIAPQLTAALTRNIDAAVKRMG